jgi:hypothetical protein
MSIFCGRGLLSRDNPIFRLIMPHPLTRKAQASSAFAGKFAVAIVPNQILGEGGSMRFKLTLWAGLCCALVSGAAFAQTSTSALSTGLGQAWPNVADQSLSPSWHAYVFMLNGIEYVQVNDAYGNVQGAVGTVGGTRFILPIGANAKRFTTTVSSDTPRTGTMVYQDANVTILAVPTANGVVLETDCGSSVQCTGGH